MGINFCLQVQFKMTAAWYCTHYLPPVSLTPVANLTPASLIPVAIRHRRHWHRWQICRRYRCHRWQFATGVNNTSEICRRCRWYRQQFCRRCRWYRWCTLTCDYLRELSKKIKRSLCNTLGLGGNWFIKKTTSKKSRDTVPLRKHMLKSAHSLSYITCDSSFLSNH